MCKILITAGPTWVPIDKVRVISNISSGRTGIEITKEALRRGVKTTLLLGPITENFNLKNKNLKILRFKYFDELYDLIKKEVSSKKYDAIIHLAAVSDYKVKKVSAAKIASGKNKLKLEFVPTPKIVSLIKKYDSDIFLVQFKLEVDASKPKLIQTAYKELIKNNADLVVANSLLGITKHKHIAYVIDKNYNIKMVKTKKEISKLLIDSIG